MKKLALLCESKIFANCSVFASKFISKPDDKLKLKNNIKRTFL